MRDSVLHEPAIQGSIGTLTVFGAASIVRPLPWPLWAAWATMTVVGVVMVIRQRRAT